MNFEDVHRDMEMIANARIGELISDVAVDLGIVDKTTKEALLIAQAAARTVAVIEDQQVAIAITDDIFKFVGSDGDAPELQNAQAVWQLANHLKYTGQLLPVRVFYASANSSFESASRKLQDSDFEETARNLVSLRSYCDVRMSEATIESVGDYNLALHDCVTMASEGSNGTEKEILDRISTIIQVHMAQRDKKSIVI
jgi:hypothetical protein